MKLHELKEVYFTKTLNSYWMNADQKKVIQLPDNIIHTQYALQNPQVFGLTQDEVDNIRNQGLDNLFDQLFDRLIDAGWIRVGSSFGTNIEVQSEDPWDAAWAIKEFLNREGEVEEVEIEIQGSWYHLSNDNVEKFIKSPSNLSKFAEQIR